MNRKAAFAIAISFIAITATAARFCGPQGGGGSQTPWTANVNANGNNLTSINQVTSASVTGSTGSGSWAIGSAGMGETLQATGFNSYAFGENCQANGDNSFAAGQNCLALGASPANFGNEYAFGIGCTARGSLNFALGNTCDAGGPSHNSACYAFGTVCSATGGDCYAMGDTCTSSGTDSFTFGHGCTASATNTLALGDFCEATGTGAIAIGYSPSGIVTNTNSSGTGSILIAYSPDGSHTSSSAGTGSVAIGQNVNSTANAAYAIGNGITNSTASSVLIGDATYSISIDHNGFHHAVLINAQTGTTYTPVANDVDNVVTLNNSGSIAVTLPQDSDLTGWAIGHSIEFDTIGAGTATFSAGTGATVHFYSPSSAGSAQSPGQYSAIVVRKTAANTLTVYGAK